MVDYSKTLVEVDEILNYLIEEDLVKIPKEVRLAIKNNKDKEYIWKYDETKKLNEQNISRDTIAFLSYLNMEYILNEEQKELMQKIHKLNEEELERTKAKKYSEDSVFKSKKMTDNVEYRVEQFEEQALVEYKEKFFIRIFNKIKSLFTKF